MFLKTFITMFCSKSMKYTHNRVLSLTNNVSFVNKLCGYTYIHTIVAVISKGLYKRN